MCGIVLSSCCLEAASSVISMISFLPFLIPSAKNARGAKPSNCGFPPMVEGRCGGWKAAEGRGGGGRDGDCIRFSGSLKPLLA